MLALTIRSLMLAILYWGGVQIGLLFFEEKISVLWPANGIALAFFIATSTRGWPLLSVAMAIGYFFGLFDLTAQPMPVKIGFLLANFIEIVPAAYFIRRVLERGTKLDSLNGILCFLGFGVFIGPLLGSSFATLVAKAGFGQEFSLAIWMGWGIGNAVSTLAVALPTYFLLSGDWYKTGIDWNRKKVNFITELTALAGFTFSAIYVNFVSVTEYSFFNGAIHILFLFAIWAALRFSMQVLSGWLLVVVLCAASYTVIAEGPFITVAQNFRTSVFYLHAFSFSLCVTGLLLGGVMADRRRIEASLRIANNAKSDFLSSMSHELRTPLNAIIGFSEIIKNQAAIPVASDRINEYADDIHQSGLHLLSLINDILDLSKVELGKEELQETNLHIPATVNSVISMVKHRAEKNHIVLDVKIEESPAILRADERKVRQILINLLTNAIKFTDAGGKVTLGVWSSSEGGCVIQIIDTGIGIAPEDIPKALSQFGQVDSHLSRKYEGSGLGLPLTKALVELHGGSLDLQSEVGVGTTVTLRFPAARIAPPAQVEDITSLDTATSVKGVA